MSTKGDANNVKLFHGTTPTAWERIKVEGLRAGNEWGMIYLTPLIEEAQCHGGVVLEVETGELRLTAFEDCQEWEVLCWTKDRIPPEQVQLYSEEK